MHKLLTTASAVALVLGVAAPASAQSVLERVLAQTAALNDVTGVFANVADNIGGVGSTTVYSNSTGNVLSQAEYDALVDNNTFTQLGSAGDYINAAGNVLTPAEYNALTVAQAAAYTVIAAGEVAYRNNGTGVVVTDTTANFNTAVNNGQTAINAYSGTTVASDATGSIDGSITNVATRIDQATANVDNQVTAISDVTANFGNMATTVLGAVNTGEIGLGTNQVVEEALANTSSAIRSTVEQIGTITGSTQVAVNSALNTMNINGSISNTLTGVNGSVAAISPDQLDILSEAGTIEIAGLSELLGSMETTVLGAVNTGTIVSGVNNQVNGTVAGIVGNSATNMFSDAAAGGN